jgi:hypothetical protein
VPCGPDTRDVSISDVCFGCFGWNNPHLMFSLGSSCFEHLNWGRP